MKLLRYGPVGEEKPGLMAEGTMRDLSAIISDITPDVLDDESLAKLKALDPASLPVVSGSPRLGIPVKGIGNVLCIGLNYRDHAAETGMDLPKEPILFSKHTSSLSGPNDPVRLSHGSEKTDWEAELAVVIGKRTSRVSEAEALSSVAAYTICNDVSERAYQTERGGQWIKGKSCETYCPLGPWLTTCDEVPNPQELNIRLSINGEVMQDGSTADMVFGVAHIVSYLSHFMTLLPGDVISTGTPAGVGMGRQRFLKAGETVQLSITGPGGLDLGGMTQQIIA